ncbi:MAG: hypothetical protein ICV83_22755, partial [Cytophagales bacterium]|nr:hypothetical protein [Cytophagales bacterium]
ALDFLEPGDFYESRHRDIFTIMRELREEGSSIDSKLIADRLYLSLHTVNTHRRNISGKTHYRNPGDLLRFAVRNGII